MSELSREEHTARALLLGYDHYRPYTNVYLRYGTSPATDERIDATTFKPVSPQEWRERYMYQLRKLSEEKDDDRV